MKISFLGCKKYPFLYLAQVFDIITFEKDGEDRFKYNNCLFKIIFYITILFQWARILGVFLYLSFKKVILLMIGKTLGRRFRLGNKLSEIDRLLRRSTTGEIIQRCSATGESELQTLLRMPMA